MEQLSFHLSDPPRLDVDKMWDEKKEIMYIGKATLQYDGTWRCLANVYGALCLIEVKVRFMENETNKKIII